jgi:hypothetical protein
MFVSEKYNFVFFEVPRTGSTSITLALNKFDSESPTFIERTKTKSLVDYHQFDLPEHNSYSEFIDVPYRVFATHRNPYQRVWSFWKHRHYHGNPDVFRQISFQRYLKWVCQPAAVREIKGALIDIPITEMFDCDRVDYWLDFKNLEQSWAGLSRKYQLDLPEIERQNSSVFMGEFSEAFDERTAAWVAKRFEKDFEYFGYDIDSWKS